MLRLARAKVMSDVPTQVDRCVLQDIAVALLDASSRQTCRPARRLLEGVFVHSTVIRNDHRVEIPQIYMRSKNRDTVVYS